MDLHRQRAVAILSALMLSTAAAAADDAMPIKVQRHAHAGDAFDVHLTLEQTVKEQDGQTLQYIEVLPSPAGTHAQTLPATPPASATASAPGSQIAPATTHILKAELSCRVDVQDVNFRGESLLLVTVTKCVSLPDGRELIPAGKVISMQGDRLDVSVSMRGGGQVSEDARAILREIYPLSYRLDDQSYGSVVTRTSGESWSVDAESVAQMETSVQSTVDKAAVKGKVTVAGPEKAGSVPCVRLKIQMSNVAVDRIRRPGNELFPRVETTSQISVLLPLDAKLPVQQVQSTTDVHAAGNRRTQETNGKVTELSLVVDTHTVVDQTITPHASDR